MKTIIKILIAVVIIVAMFNGGMAAFNNYSFEDAVHEGLLYNPGATDADIVDMVMKLARDYAIPLDPADVKITSRGSDLLVNMTYTDTVRLVPGIIEREFTFNPATSTRLLGKGRLK